MIHKIKFIEYNYIDSCGMHIEIDGKPLFYDGMYTTNCIEEILDTLGIKYTLEIEDVQEISQIITKRKKLVDDE